jgi:hypothetical protein
MVSVIFLLAMTPPEATDFSAWTPERIGTTAFLLALLTVVVRSALTRTWVPGVFLTEMKAERDLLAGELRQANTTVASLSQALAHSTEANQQLARATDPRVLQGRGPGQGGGP